MARHRKTSSRHQGRGKGPARRLTLEELLERLMKEYPAMREAGQVESPTANLSLFELHS